MIDYSRNFFYEQQLAEKRGLALGKKYKQKKILR